MRKLILVSFGFMGWAFYEASGGDDFTPASAAPAVVETAVLETPAPARNADESLQTVNVSNLSAELKAIAQKAAADAVAEVVLASLSGAEGAQNVSEPPEDLREVTGSRVNMRKGPSTTYPVLAQVLKGERLIVLQDPGNGWLKVRTEENRIGWMAASLISAAAQ